jgi:hypothetical protein
MGGLAMPRTSAAHTSDGVRRLIETLTREFGQRAARRVPPEFLGHMQAAVRELFLAAAVLCDTALKTAEETTAEARRRVHRIPVSAAPASRRRPARRRG